MARLARASSAVASAMLPGGDVWPAGAATAVDSSSSRAASPSARSPAFASVAVTATARSFGPAALAFASRAAAPCARRAGGARGHQGAGAGHARTVFHEASQPHQLDGVAIVIRAYQTGRDRHEAPLRGMPYRLSRPSRHARR